MPVNLLVIRDPDHENDYIYDTPVNVITIDIGGDWRDYKEFCSALQGDDEDALEYERDLLSRVAGLDESNVVRREAEAYFKRARQI